MFGLGMGEILLIAVVALLVLGPEKLPQAAKSIGQGIRDLRKQTKDLQDSIEQDTQLGDAMRELKGALRDEPVPPKRLPPKQGQNQRAGPTIAPASGAEPRAAGGGKGGEAEETAGAAGESEAGAPKPATAGPAAAGPNEDRTATDGEKSTASDLNREAEGAAPKPGAAPRDGSAHG